MKKLKLIRVIASTLMVVSIFALNPIGVSAEWKQNSTGWWYKKGNSYAKGWEDISGKTYYFDSNGYMKTGWINDKKKTGWINDKNADKDIWYYCYSNGEKAEDTVIDGYVLGVYGNYVEGVTEDEVEQYKKLIYENVEIESDDKVKVHYSDKNITMHGYNDFHVNNGILFEIIQPDQWYEASKICIDKDNKKIYLITAGYSLCELKNKQVVKEFRYADY